MNTTSLSLLDRLKEAGPESADWHKLKDVYLPLIRSWLAGVPGLRDDADDLRRRFSSCCCAGFRRSSGGDTAPFAPGCGRSP